MKIAIYSIVAVIVAVIGVYTISPLFVNTTIDEPSPITPMKKDDMVIEKSDFGNIASKTGSFVGIGDGIHDAKGKIFVIPAEHSYILRLEEFRSTNGPDLYVYLSTDKAASDFVNLGRLKANIGNQNYDIPPDTDLSKYNTVLIWCKQFSVLFGSAELT